MAIAHQCTHADTAEHTPQVQDRESRTSNHCQLNLPSSPSQVDPKIVALVRSVLSKDAAEISDPRVLAQIPKYLAKAENVRNVAEAFVCEEPHHVLPFLRLLQGLKCPIKQNIYEGICFRLAEVKGWHHVLDVVALGISQTGRTTVRLLNWKSRALLEMKRYGQLQDVLEEFKTNNLKPNQRTYHLVLTGHIRNCDIVRARHCLQRMEEAGFSPNHLTHALLATNYRSLGSDLQVHYRALEDLSSMDHTLGVAVLNSLIQLRLDSHDVPRTLHLLLHFNPVLVQALVLALSGNIIPQGTSKHDISYMSHLHTPPSRHSFVPNAATYSIVINYLARHGAFEHITNVLYAVVMNGIKASPTIVISLIHAFASAGRIDIAVKLVANICQSQASCLEALAPMSSTALDGYLLDCADIRPSTALFNALLQNALPRKGLNAMSTVLKVMHANGVSPNAATLDIFIAYLRKRETVRPRMLLRILRQFVSPGIYPTSRQLHSILSSIFRYEKFLLYGSGWNASAARLSRYQRAKTQSYPEDRVTSTSKPFDPSAGLQLPRWLRYKSLARAIIEPLVSSAVNSDAATFALRIRHDAVIKSDVDSAEGILRASLSRGIHATQYHYSALLEGYALIGDMSGAEAVLRSMGKVGLKPNVVIYTILIVGYGRYGHPEKALRIFRQMLNEGCKPDVPAVDAICGALFASGAYALARRVLIDSWTYIQPFPDEHHSLSLRQLSVRFRSLHNANQSVPMSMTKHRRRLLHFKVRDLVQKWRKMSGKHSSKSQTVV
ncbi:hypothetical protein M378DRAFT_6652 [Amanita muscaria Koide BX008]|uniref:Pentatricopeptide repeat-containing protein n=1 Tax=Amanita muscaria (strain Koide BX008) TaxID=946122 RepID=A0A0C2T4A6_AMAMK|nr:hypothetical protein M378DRAFT_6652 [Amanita muscaria Koide BX008]